jgi:hypothetical protein
MPQEPTAAEIYGRDFPNGAVVFEEGDPAIDAITAGELAEAEGLATPAGPGPGLELLRARLSTDGTVRDAAELRDLLELVDLQRRFEPEERPRSTP